MTASPGPEGDRPTGPARVPTGSGRSTDDAAGRAGADGRTGSGELGGADGLVAPGAPADADRDPDLDALSELGGTEHLSALLEWRPSYQHEVAVVGWLRHVSYGDGSEDTPAAVLRIENPEDPGEIAMTADDLAALAERLLDLHRALRGSRREGVIPEPRAESDDG